MHNTSQQDNEIQMHKISSWDDAIADIKKRIKDMEFSLKVFQERKRNGEPWPLDEKTGTAT